MTDSRFPSTNDPLDETNLQAALSRTNATDYVVSGLDPADADIVAGPALDLPGGVAQVAGSGTETETLTVDARSGLSLTDSAINYVYLSYDPTVTDTDPSTDDAVSITVNTTQTPPSDPSVLVCTANTSTNTVTLLSRTPTVTGRNQLRTATYDWEVHQDGDVWVADGRDGAGAIRETAAEALQYAADQGGAIHLVDSVPPGEAIDTTVSISDAFRGPGVRGEGTIYATSGADPVFTFDGSNDVRDIYLRCQGNSIDGLDCIEMGRGAVLEDVTVENTNGNGVVLSGCQQMTVRNLTFGRCGDPGNDTGELRLTDNPAGDLESNAINIQGLHSHGGNDPQGSTVLMRADNGGGDRPRNIHLSDVNIENGPSGAVPVIELCGRDNWVRGGRIMGLDDASTVFQLQDPRAPSMHIRDIVAIGATGAPLRFVSNAASTVASSQAATLDDMASVHGCDVDTDGAAILADGYNQTDDPLVVSDTTFKGTNGAVDITASSGVTPAVRLQSLFCNGQEVRVQGARLMTAGIEDASYPTGFGDQFGPHLIADDGSYSPLYGNNRVTDSSGVATLDLRGIVQLPGGATVDARVDTVNTGSRPFFVEWEVVDLSGDGIADAVRATVYDDSGATVGDNDVGVELNVRPHT